jgi:hypothetical protein
LTVAGSVIEQLAAASALAPHAATAIAAASALKNART